MNPCTPIATAYPMHENIDFTAPELDFSGLAGSGERLRKQDCDLWPCRLEFIKEHGLSGCAYHPIDYDPNPCNPLTHWTHIFPFEECEGPELRGGFFYPENLSKCWTHDGHMLDTMWTNTNPCDTGT